jgi:hypothetical protein
MQVNGFNRSRLGKYSFCAGIDLLLDVIEPNAAVDAEARAYPPRCFPGTREQYIDDITKWSSASSSNQSPSICWMYGPAGVGKSAIAQTCAELVKDTSLFGAAFFFSINGRDDHTRFFTTIAYQLSTVLPEYKKCLNNVVLNDKTIVKKTIATQFKALIIEPLRGLEEVERRTVFIDGLDECRSTSAQCQIIELIATSVRDKTTPFRWAFFSRAEAHIEATFSLDYIKPLCVNILLPISRNIDGKIELYLKGGFENILHRQNLSFSVPWPPPQAIRKLVDASAGLYAYPATVLRFIDSFPTGDSKEALAVVLDVISRPNSPIGRPSPFAELDAFYMLIMQRIPYHMLSSVQLLFATMVEYGLKVNPTASLNISAIFNQIRLPEAVLNSIRKHLHTVLYFQDATAAPQPRTDIDVTRPYYKQRTPSDQERHAILSSSGKLAFYHKSFYDFLADPARSATFCATTLEAQLKVFEGHLQTHFVLAQAYATQGTGMIDLLTLYVS